MAEARSNDFDIRLLDGRRETLNYKVRPDEAGLRLDHFLAARLKWRSRSSLRKLMDDELISIAPRAGEVRSPRANRKVLEGDVVRVQLPRTVRDEALAQARRPVLELERLFEDDWLIGIDKPPNIACHPAGRLLHWTVITELHRAYRDFDDPTKDIVPKLVHRLDLETSGVLLVAKTLPALVAVQQQFEKRTIAKEYQVLVHGEVERDEGLIDLPIGPALSEVRNARAIRHDVGQASRTRYRVIERWRGYSRLHIQLLTGRHHQIRVHLAALGHPVVGDKIYGKDEEIFLRFCNRTITDDDWAVLELPRQALHSHSLTFRHPAADAGDGELRIESPWPADLAAFCAGLEPR